MTNATSRRLSVLLVALAALLPPLTGGPVGANDGPVPATPTGLNAVGFHGGIGLGHGPVNPHVSLSGTTRATSASPTIGFFAGMPTRTTRGSSR